MRDANYALGEYHNVKGAESVDALRASENK